MVAVDGQLPIRLEAGDFVLMPATPSFILSGFDPVTPEEITPKATPSPTGEIRHGRSDGQPDVRMLGSYFQFDSPDAPLLVTLLPVLLHVRGVERLSVLVQLVRDAAQAVRQTSTAERALAALEPYPSFGLAGARLPHINLSVQPQCYDGECQDCQVGCHGVECAHQQQRLGHQHK